MATRGTHVIDKGFKRIVADIRATTKLAVSVGLHGDADGELVTYGAANEFGTADGHVPERSYIRSTVDEEMENLRRIRNRALVRIADGTLRPHQGIGLIGAYLQGKIQEKIVSGVPPPNAPATIAAKGSSVTLVDEGRLRQAVTYEVHEDGFKPAGG